MSQQPNPRGTFLKIAEALRAQLDANPEMTELPSAAELMRTHGVSRGVALRVFAVLQKERCAEPVPGGRWRVIREDDEPRDRRPLADRIAEVIRVDKLEIGEPFLSSAALSDRFGVSRPTVGKALSQLEADGLLSESRQGKPRTVLAWPGREGRV